MVTSISILRPENADMGQLANEDVIAELRPGTGRQVKMQTVVTTLHVKAHLLELSPTLLLISANPYPMLENMPPTTPT